ncbi:MAG: AAA family ATPase, partial [Gemmatimonadota bacterium]
MTHPPALLFLRTFGGATLHTNADGRQLLGPGKPLALLLYLALTPGRRASREFLMDLLWADLEVERARSALRQVLFHLRRLLGEDALPGSEELTLARAIDTDRDRFLSAIEKGELQAAVDAYDGEFLPAFGVPGGASFEHWADLERDRLRTAFLRSAELLVRRQLNEGRSREALKLSRRAHDELPSSEVAWRLLLETAVAARDFLTAAMEAAALERWAADEGRTLEPTTRQVIARTRSVQAPAHESAPDALAAELTGREREFSAIIAGWERARSGRARIIHLTAPAGLGKTRLLREATARLRAVGASVVEVRGLPGDRDMPYAFAGDLAAGIAALPGAAAISPASASTLLGLNPSLSTLFAGEPNHATGDDALRRRAQAMVELVHAVADEQPFVLALDDVHWVDTQSYRMLDALLGRLGDAHVLCLTAARPERLLTAQDVSVLPVPALTPRQVADLVTALGALPDEPGWAGTFAEGLHAATRGSPLLVLETLRLAIGDGILSIEGDAWRCDDEVRLASLLRAGEALRQRVGALPRAQGWVLALLATAGTPLGTEFLAQAIRGSATEVNEVLGILERQGLVARMGGGWTPAHDEIAAAARAAMDATQHADAERAVGQTLVEGAGQDPHHVLRGVRHLVAAGEHACVTQQFHRYARLSRQRRDRRPFRELAAELLGVPPESPDVAGLVRTLPAWWRVGLWSAGRQRAAAVVVVVAAAASVSAARVHDARAEMIQRLVYVDSAGVTSIVNVTRDWDLVDGPASPSRGNGTLASEAAGFQDRAPAISPDGKSAAWIRHSGDSTTLDIWLRTPTGTRRLTRQYRDDLVTEWTPDGSALVGMTNRWSPSWKGNYDIAVFDTVKGDARPITKNLLHEGGATVSPDGTRIAFIREPEDGPPQLCVAPFDGASDAECRLPGGFGMATLIGWSGLTEVIITLDSAGARPLSRYDWLRNQRTPLLGPHVYNVRLSPDRRWVVAAARIEGIPGFSDWIIPVDRPSRARRVKGPGNGPGLLRYWEGKADPSQVIDHIAFVDSTTTVLPGLGTRLAIRALSVNATEIPLYAPVRWRSNDTTIATVDSSGVVLPRGIGSVVIVASLAARRTATKRLEVRGEAARTLLEENWDDKWQSRWITFGDPQPTVTVGPGGRRAFWNRGDGTYPSMALSRQALSVKNGAGIEVQVSSPLTRQTWQHARAYLVGGIDTTAYRGADQKKGPPSLGRSDAVCGVSYPAESGEYGRGRLAINAGVAAVVDLGDVSKAMRDGTPWTLRLQVLPDGRCGVAVNGRVVFLSTESILLDPEYRVRLGDESAEGKLLHGPVRVWTGVRT